MSVKALPIQGWEEQSIWGFDGPTGYFAQLSRNGFKPGPDDAPEISVGYLGKHGSIWSTPRLWEAIAEATGRPVEEVRAATAWRQGEPLPWEKPARPVGSIGIGVPRRQG